MKNQNTSIYEQVFIFEVKVRNDNRKCLKMKEETKCKNNRYFNDTMQLLSQYAASVMIYVNLLIVLIFKCFTFQCLYRF